MEPLVDICRKRHVAQKDVSFLRIKLREKCLHVPFSISTNVYLQFSLPICKNIITLGAS